MFSFLKEKIKSAVSLFSKKIEDEKFDPVLVEEENKILLQHSEEASIREPERIKEDYSSLTVKSDPLEVSIPKKDVSFETKELRKAPVSLVPEEKNIAKPASYEDQQKKEIKDERIQQKATGFFAKLKQTIVTKRVTKEEFDPLFSSLELAMLENNMAIEVIEKIKENLKTQLVDQPIERGEVSQVIFDSLKQTINALLSFSVPNIVEKIKEKKPFVICFVGINGGGKTTTIAKVAHYLQKQNCTCVLAAGDTFRAAAIQQLEQHASKLHVKIVKHDYGSDAAAVAFDAISYAKAHRIDAVLIDTAGRLHSNTNLMDELKKVVRVSKPDMTIFVGESITGNDCIEQAQKFDALVGIDGIILTKSDVDEKGGAAVSISYVTGKPILFFGTGQRYEDLILFDKEKVMENIGI